MNYCVLDSVLSPQLRQRYYNRDLTSVSPSLMRRAGVNIKGIVISVFGSIWDSRALVTLIPVSLALFSQYDKTQLKKFIG